MQQRRLWQSRRTWLLVLALWLVWALISSVELVARLMWLQQPASFGAALLAKLPLALALAAMTPGVLALSRKYPLLGESRLRHWDVHLWACLTMVVVVDLLSCALGAWTTGLPFDLGTPRQYAVRVLGLWLLPIGMLYGLIVAVDNGLRHFVTARQRAEAAARLEAQAAQARLEALKLQLHPHFLFNALHSIATLVRTEQPADAVRVTAELGTLLRRLLDDAPRQEVSLREELEFVRAYLGIELIRFRDRLRVTYDVDGGAEEALVPHLLLQPLVENALRHGLQAREAGGCLTISARREGESLALSVEDDGSGAREPVRGNGIGLANARARLREMYGEAQSLELEDLGGAGTRVRVRLPYRDVAPTATAAVG